MLPIGRRLGKTHKVAHALADRELAPLRSSVSEWIVLTQIREAGAIGASQTEIARHSGMGGPALVRHIDRLEADGLVAVIVDQHASSALERCHVGGWAPTP